MLSPLIDLSALLKVGGWVDDFLTVVVDSVNAKFGNFVGIVEVNRTSSFIISNPVGF